jgi:hypothetical protein
MFNASGEEDLHAHANAQHGPVTGETPVDDLVAVGGPDPCHAGGEGTHAGDY